MMIPSRGARHDKLPPAPVLKALVPGIVVRCNNCPDSVLEDDAFDGTGLLDGEKCDFVKLMADKAGWTFVQRGTEAWVVCPHCIAAEEKTDQKPSLTYDESRPCPKCGAGEAGTSYRRGTEIDKQFSSEHLLRTCVRCGFKWGESVLNAEPEPEHDDGSDDGKHE